MKSDFSNVERSQNYQNKCKNCSDWPFCNDTLLCNLASMTEGPTLEIPLLVMIILRSLNSTKSDWPFCHDNDINI